MVQFLKIEARRILKSRSFWLALFVGCLLTVTQYFAMVLPARQELFNSQWGGFGASYPFSWYQLWIGGELISYQSYLYFLLVPVLCVMANSASLAQDRASGYTSLLFSRGQKRHYYLAKFIATFLSGGAVVVAPLLLNVFFSACTLPSLLPDPATGTFMISDVNMWSGLYFAHPNVYTLCYLLLIFAFSGTVAVFDLTVGTWVYNNFMLMVLPFVLHLFLYAFCNLNRWYIYSPFFYLNPAQATGNLRFWPIATEIIVVLVASLAVYLWRMRRDETLA